MGNLTKEQIKTIKEQLKQQLGGLEEPQKKEASEFINSMDDDQFEEFLIQRGMITDPKKTNNLNQKIKSEKPECIYCLISQGKVESFKIYEDKKHLAVLEINPMSEAHTILIPKEHKSYTKELSQKSFKIADKIGRFLLKKLKNENIESYEVSSSAQLGHAIINIIPIYKEKTLSYERKNLSKEELKKVSLKIGFLKEVTEKIKSEPPEKIQDIIKLKRRIP